MNQELRIAIVYGSSREHRQCDRVVDWVRTQAARHQAVTLDLIDPRVHAPGQPGAAELAARVARADAFIVVTPEYNHGYPAPLKALIDGAYREWNAKAAGFVSYGGSSGGVRAVEQLRQVFAELHVVTMRDAVGFAHVGDRIGADGQLEATRHEESAFRKMLLQLRWWAGALRAARGAAPYQEAVQ